MHRISRLVGHLTGSGDGDNGMTQGGLENAALVPVGYAAHTFPADATLGHLRWLSQKHKLRQDVCLLGPPGPMKRRLALLFCELMGLQAETLVVTRDTTEADLKQRANIEDGSLIYHDQAPVKCALYGRVLILDGIEKAERNVLPTLNNLLENREIALSDGRFIVESKRFDTLQQQFSAKQLRDKQLIRAHPDFWVIALTVPVPRFPGYTMDPPLRSRFQAKTVDPLVLTAKYQEVLYWLRKSQPDSDIGADIKAVLVNALSAVSALRTVSETHNTNLGTTRLPFFSDSSCNFIVKWLQLMHSVGGTLRVTPELVERVFPFQDMCSDVQIDAFLELLAKFGIKTDGTSDNLVLESVETRDPSSPSSPSSPSLSSSSALSTQHTLPFRANLVRTGSGSKYVVGFGSDAAGQKKRTIAAPRDFLRTELHAQLLAGIVECHALGRDICILGPAGSGKSVFARHAADVLQYSGNVSVMSLYKDMSARDLLMRRSTDRKGNSIWIRSPLVDACLHGHCLLLDGIDKLSPSILSTIYPLIMGRELTLFDGTRLLPLKSVQLLEQSLCLFGKQKLSMSASLAIDCAKQVVRDASILPVHPRFRILALAVPPKSAERKSEPWLLDETTPLFCFFRLSPLANTTDFLKGLVKQATMQQVESLTQLHHALRDLATDGKRSTPGKSGPRLDLSLRHFVRILRRVALYPEDFAAIVSNSLLVPFLPLALRRAVATTIADVAGAKSPPPPSSSAAATDLVIEHTFSPSGDPLLKIGDVSFPCKNSTNGELIPDIEFVDIQQHVVLLQSMLKDFCAGEKYLLLIGTQGVGKNKVCDRLLQKLGYEREYMQLHRDTTVSALTLAPTLDRGTIVYEDSALVRAAKNGFCLVIDEADKAPLQVVAVLKSLIEDGEMLLSDGRRILRDPVYTGAASDSDVIAMHPDFRIITLANKPGWPFLGNDFFREVGDVFSCHVVLNPDYESELTLLRAYAPAVDESTLNLLIKIFQRLRASVDLGDLTYPYSTRELVNVAKHLNAYPDDGLISAIENALRFDSYDEDVRRSLKDILSKFEVPVLRGSTESLQISVQTESILPQTAMKMEDWFKPPANVIAKGPSKTRVWNGHVWLTNATVERQSDVFGSSRLDRFSEEVSRFRGVATSIPTSPRKNNGAGAIPIALTAWADGSVFVLSNHPFTLHCFFPEHSTEIARSGYLRVSLEDAVPTFFIEDTNIQLGSIGLSNQIIITSAPAGLVVCVQLRKSAKDESLWDSHVGVLSAPDLCSSRASKIRSRMLKYATTIYKPANNVVFSSNAPADSYTKTHAKTFMTLLAAHGVVVFQTGNVVLLLKLASSDSELAEGKCAREVEEVDISALMPSELAREAFSVIPLSPDRLLIQSGTANAVQHQKYILVRLGHQKWGVVPVADPMPIQFTSATCFVSPSLCSTLYLVGDDAKTLLLCQDGKRTLAIAGAAADCDVEHRLVCCTGHRLVFPVKRCGVSENLAHCLCIVSAGSDSPSSEKYIPILPRAAKRGAITLQQVQTHQPNQHAKIISAASIPGSSKVLTLQEDGYVRIFETCPDNLSAQLDTWRALFGNARLGDEGSADHALLAAVATENKTMAADPEMPKEGKEDNEPHVGGNTYKGGSGGRDTAGMGGIGGPYRVNSGHPVHQMEGIANVKISEASAQAALEMKIKLLQEQLDSINMSETDFDLYQEIYSHVANEVEQVRHIFQAQEAKLREREWLRNQTEGDLDSSKLVDGVCGDSNVYRRRGHVAIPEGLPQRIPKRMHFVIDCSGSMYRFNSNDKRLDRMIDTVLLVIESLRGFETKFEYSLVGHSGDQCDILLADYGQPPSTTGEKLKILQTLAVHSQYCSSGDKTLQAMEHGMRQVTSQAGDDYFMIAVSDANLERYSISATRIKSILDSDAQVNAYAIFISSGGTSYQREIEKALPQRAFFCSSGTSQLPGIFKKIFAHAAK